MKQKPTKTRKMLLGITWRSLLLGSILIAMNFYWVTVIELKYYALDGSCLSLFIEPVFVHYHDLLDRSVNPDVRRWRSVNAVMTALCRI